MPTSSQQKLTAGSARPHSSFSRWLRSVGLTNEFDTFMENVAALLSAGLDITNALQSVEEETTNRRMRRIIHEIRLSIDQGESLTTALTRAGSLPNRVVTLIRFGELSGKLVENLKVVVLQNDKERQFRSRVRSSLMYSVIVTVMTVVIGTATTVFTLPRLADFYASSNVALPPLTEALISLGKFIGAYAIFIIPPVALILIIVLYFLFSFPRTRFIGHSLLFRIPLIRGLIVNVEVSRFCYVLGTTLSAGVPLTDALDATTGSTTYANYRQFYQYLHDRVNEGYSFRRCFTEFPNAQRLFPPSVRQLLIAAERSGMLAESLLKIGAMYEQKTDTLARNIPAILEPVLLLLISVGVVLLALATILPIYNLSNVIQ